MLPCFPAWLGPEVGPSPLSLLRQWQFVCRKTLARPTTHPQCQSHLHPLFSSSNQRLGGKSTWSNQSWTQGHAGRDGSSTQTRLVRPPALGHVVKACGPPARHWQQCHAASDRFKPHNSRPSHWRPWKAHASQPSTKAGRLSGDKISGTRHPNLKPLKGEEDKHAILHRNSKPCLH